MKKKRIGFFLLSLAGFDLLSCSPDAGASNGTTDDGNDPVDATLAVPQDLTATSLSTSGISLSWTDPSDEETGFQLERSISASSGFSLIATCGPDSDTCVDSGLAADTSYFYRIRTVKNDAYSAWSATATARTEAEPTYPTLSVFPFYRGASYSNASDAYRTYNIERSSSQSMSTTTGLVASGYYYLSEERNPAWGANYLSRSINVSRTGYSIPVPDGTLREGGTGVHAQIVYSYVPDDGSAATAWPVDTDVTLRFLWPMDEASAEAALTLSCGPMTDIPGTFAWPDATTLVFTPASAFPGGDTVTVSMAATAESAAGTAIPVAFSYPFETEASETAAWTRTDVTDENIEAATGGELYCLDSGVYVIAGTEAYTGTSGAITLYHTGVVDGPYANSLYKTVVDGTDYATASIPVPSVYSLALTLDTSGELVAGYGDASYYWEVHYARAPDWVDVDTDLDNDVSGDTLYSYIQDDGAGNPLILYINSETAGYAGDISLYYEDPAEGWQREDVLTGGWVEGSLLSSNATTLTFLCRTATALNLMAMTGTGSLLSNETIFEGAGLDGIKAVVDGDVTYVAVGTSAGFAYFKMEGGIVTEYAKETDLDTRVLGLDIDADGYAHLLVSIRAETGSHSIAYFTNKP